MKADQTDQAAFLQQDDNYRSSHFDDMLRISEAFRYQGSPQMTFSRLLDVISEVLECAACSIHLIDPDGERMYLAAAKGTPGGMPELAMQFVSVEDLDRSYMAPLRNLEPYRPEEYKTGLETLDWLPVMETIESKIVKIPLVSHGRLVGTLTVVGPRCLKEQFESDKRWLTVVGCQIGEFVDQLNVFEDFRDSSVIQERERLSREIHDNLSQSVGVIRLLASQMADNLREGNLDKLARDVELIEAAAQEAYASVRVEMMDLRCAAEPNGSVVMQIHDYVSNFRARWGLEATFEVDGGLVELPITSLEAAQLFRVIQEALSNVRRHAHASRVDVRMGVSQDTLCASIVDDGVGFDPASVPAGKLGLRVMLERMADVGGRLWVESQPGCGTKVSLAVPTDETSRA